MKYAPSIYARAFLETKPDVKNFLRVVAKNGDFQRIDTIVEAIEAQAAKDRGGHMVELEFARETPLRQKFTFTAKDLIRTSINPFLVAGVRVTIDGEKELDMSLRRKLNKLFS